MIAGVFLSAAVAASSPASTPAAQAPSAEEVAAFGPVAVRRVIDKLKDPESARFRATFVSQLPTGELVLCGEINAKNGYGGYTGFTPFFSTARGPFVEVASKANARLFASLWKVVCSNAVDTFTPAGPARAD